MKPLFQIENTRPRRTVRLYGRVLASKVSGGRATMTLTLEELLGEPCVRLLRAGRITVVGEVPPQLAALLSSEEVIETPVVEEPIPAAAPVSDVPAVEVPSVVESTESVEPVASEASVEVLSEATVEEAVVEEAVDLGKLSLSELRKMAEDLGIPATGTKKVLAAAIEAHKAGESHGE